MAAASSPLDDLGRLKPHPSLMKDAIAPPSTFPATLLNVPKLVDGHGQYYDHRVHPITDFNTTLLMPKGKYVEAGPKVKLLCLPSQTRILADISRIPTAGLHIDVFRCPVDDCTWSTPQRYHVKSHVVRRHKELSDRPYSHPTCSWHPRVLTDMWNRHLPEVEERWEYEKVPEQPDVVITEGAVIEQIHVPQSVAPDIADAPSLGHAEQVTAGREDARPSTGDTMQIPAENIEAELMDGGAIQSHTVPALSQPVSMCNTDEAEKSAPGIIPWIPGRFRRGVSQERSQEPGPVSSAGEQQEWMLGGEHNVPVNSWKSKATDEAFDLGAREPSLDWKALLPGGVIPPNARTAMPSAMFQSMYNQGMRKAGLGNDEEFRRNSTAWIHSQDERGRRGDNG